MARSSGPKRTERRVLSASRFENAAAGGSQPLNVRSQTIRHRVIIAFHATAKSEHIGSTSLLLLQRAPVALCLLNRKTRFIEIGWRMLRAHLYAILPTIPGFRGGIPRN